MNRTRTLARARTAMDMEFMKLPEEFQVMIVDENFSTTMLLNDEWQVAQPYFTARQQLSALESLYREMDELDRLREQAAQTEYYLAGQFKAIFGRSLSGRLNYLAAGWVLPGLNRLADKLVDQVDKVVTG